MPARPKWRERLYEIIFEADTWAGKAFDVVLILSIFASVTAVSLESIAWIRARHGATLLRIEWFFTLLFTLEYLLRLIAVDRPARYARSFFGIIDLLAILPSYLSFIFYGAQSLLVIRVFRILRVFRIFKLGKYLGEAHILSTGLKASQPKITVFLVTVLATVITLGAIMFLVEGEENGFTSIPISIYWAIVTMTTVGYGDISPHTPLGQTLASVLMIMGYGVIAVPTGIVTVELARSTQVPLNQLSPRECHNCGTTGHGGDALYCRRCGNQLEPPAPSGSH